VLTLALLHVDWMFAEPQNATVSGVLGEGVTVNGVATTLTRAHVLPVGATVAAPPGTKVFLSQQWDTPQGHCMYWAIINGGSHQVANIGASCPVVNSQLSLSTAAATPGVTIIADVHVPAPPAVSTSGGSVVGRPQGLGSRPLHARLEEELDELGLMGPLMPGQGFMGGTDYKEVSVAAPSDCRQLCAAESACVAMTFSNMQKKCWLKTQPTTLVPSGDMVSAVKRK
jgi:hypothetical protein